MPVMPPGIFTNYSPAPRNGALNVLLLDTLNTPMRDQAYVRDQLRKYLKNAGPTDRIAIFGLTSRLILLQGFTSDPALLKAAIDQKNPRASPLLDDAVGGGGAEPVSDTLSSLDNSPEMAELVANLQQFEAQEQSFQLQLRAKYTLDALNQIARGLSGIPGRKNLIWFSGSFPINILPDGDLQNPFAVVASSEEEFRETTNMLTASQVAVYPIDARGLMVSPSLNAANSGSKYAGNPTTFGKDQSKFFQQTADEHSTMLQMAEQTGGRAFINTNDLTQAVAKSIEAGSNFYTLAYSPTDTNWNGSFRKIQVKLEQQGYTLAYRRGYYADNPNAPPKKGAVTATTPANAPPPLDPMRAAMMHGGPDPTQILIKVRVLPAASAPKTNSPPTTHSTLTSRPRGPTAATTSTTPPTPTTSSSPGPPKTLTRAPSDFSSTSTTRMETSSTSSTTRPTPTSLPPPTPTCYTAASPGTRRSASQSKATSTSASASTTSTATASLPSKFPSPRSKIYPHSRKQRNSRSSRRDLAMKNCELAPAPLRSYPYR